MNLVLDNTVEVDVRPKAKGGVEKRTPLGRILLKGDTITAVLSPSAAPRAAAPAVAAEGDAAAAMAE